MKKEILIAIFIGVLLGLIVVLGIWTANKSMKSPKNIANNNQEQISPSENQKQETTSDQKINLEITSPKNNSVSNSEKLEISGKTAKNAIIAIVYPDGETILEAEDDGSFKTTITLVGANNEIKISAYDSQGEETTEIINVIYSTAEI